MISPMQARAHIRRIAQMPEIKKVALAESYGLILAADMKALFPLPIADNAAMDGFVIRSSDVFRASFDVPIRLKLSGTIKAGDARRVHVAEGRAFRIMTGAFIPQGGNSVIPKEDAEIVDGHLLLKTPVRQGQHIRRRSEEIKKGQTILRKGSHLNPAAVGILASLGYACVPVYRKPKVAILATGSELVAPGRKLSQGKIFDSNSWMIRAALVQMGLDPFVILTLRDEIKQVRKSIRSVLGTSDYLLLLGGVSVGDYDVVKEALHKEGVKTIFWKVNQKPGKPLFFGRKGKKIIFGLPGNPAAAFTCFYEYVYPALRRTLGHENPDLKRLTVKVEGTVTADPKRHLFLKAKTGSRKNAGMMTAQILPRQGSHMLSSLYESQGFIHVPPDCKGQVKDRMLDFHLFPWVAA